MKDTYEVPISTASAAAGDAFNRALKSFAGYDADLVERVQAVQQADPGSRSDTALGLRHHAGL